MLSHKPDAGLGVSAVADDVPQAPHFVAARRPGLLEHRFERLPVGVYV